MFGYVKPFPPELKVKEYDFYRSVYCGLCRALGRRIALCAELTLSYDIVFLALLLMSLKNEKTEIKFRRCGVHPLKKRPVLEINTSLIEAAEIGALLSYYKVIDDLHDCRGIRKLTPLLLLPAIKYMKKKVNPDKEFDQAIKSGLEILNKLETENTLSVDTPAEAFGNVMSVVFAYACGDGINRRIGEVIGKYIGRWIYIVDALDDIEKDKKSGSYNPFVFSDDISPVHIETALIGELQNIEKAVNLIDFRDGGIENIIKNIIYLGMPQRAKEIMEKRKLP